LKLEPDWNALPHNTPPSLRRLIRRSLEKNPRRRLRDLADARLDLEDALRETAQGPAPAAAKERTNLAMVVLAVAATAITTAAVTWWRLYPDVPSVRRFAINIPAEASFAPVNDPPVVISPDGSKIVYAATTKGKPDSLMLRRFDQLDATPIPGTERGHSPFFSPDGEWMGFFSDVDRTLRKVSLAGGSPVTLSSAAASHLGASWGSDDTIVFAGPGLNRISSSGGAPEGLTAPEADKNETRHSFPHILPNAKGVLFTATIGNASRIEVFRFDTRERKVLVENGTAARYALTGHIIYSQGARLFAIPFDQNRFETTGPATPVLEGLAITDDGPATFSFSDDGTLIYVAGNAQQEGPRRALFWVNRQGREEPINAPLRRYVSARISPDGKQLAVHARDAEDDVWIWNFARGTLTRLTFDRAPDGYPIWTPDGRRIVFSSQRGGNAGNLFWQAADGTGAVERLTESPNPQTPVSFSPDGKRLILAEIRTATGEDIAALPLDGDRRAATLISTPFFERNPEISPDGRWMAYESNESGRPEIYVRPNPNIDSGRWQVSTQGGSRPAWARGGRELFYLAGPGRLMAVPIQPGKTFEAGNPELLFELPFIAPSFSREYDVAPDGQRFVMIKQADATEQGPRGPDVTVVLNWFEELKRLAGEK
ncbi:MAG: PD40 domain-containing protein, partial [Acidobacteria bacterium]|nr:PD40 domain-containing protein [Acidobacteriota bacterium]